jgi:hypothetical protein
LKKYLGDVEKEFEVMRGELKDSESNANVFKWTSVGLFGLLTVATGFLGYEHFKNK